MTAFLAEAKNGPHIRSCARWKDAKKLYYPCVPSATIPGGHLRGDSCSVLFDSPSGKPSMQKEAACFPLQHKAYADAAYRAGPSHVEPHIFAYSGRRDRKANSMPQRGVFSLVKDVA